MSNSGAMRVLISGASGFIGSALVPSLESSGVEITGLSRGQLRREHDDEDDSVRSAKPIAPESVSGFDTVIHPRREHRRPLDRVEEGKDSRQPRHRHAQPGASPGASQKQKNNPKYSCSSAIGYYGDRGDEPLNESSNPGTGFLPDVCRESEAATQPAADAGIRTVQIRTGIVLSSKGGALAKMLTPFKMGVGGRIGNGRQWMSWMNIEDMVGAILHILNAG